MTDATTDKIKLFYYYKRLFMPIPGPIVIVEDDIDDQEIISDVLNELGLHNETLFFTRTQNAFQYLKTTSKQPFIIICDINLPEINGFEFKKQVDKDPILRKKSIPFVFLSTAFEKSIVNAAYSEMTIQGFFQKETSVDEIKKTLKVILDYWRICKHPNDV